MPRSILALSSGPLAVLLISSGAAARTDVQGPGVQLTAAPAVLALDAGGVQQLGIETDPPAAGATVLVLGSLSGTSPGVPLGGGLVLPLNPDSYLTHTLHHPSQPPLAGALQTLDATGTASASFTLPPASDPGLSGLVLHHAVVVIDPSSAILDVSAAAPLALVPTKTVWTVSIHTPADFPDIAVALDSPAVKNGDVLLVHPSGGGLTYSSFTLTKAVHILCASDDVFFYAHEVLVDGAEEFTLAGLKTRSLRIQNVPGRGMLDRCEVGGLYIGDYDAHYYLGFTLLLGCDELLVTRSFFHGDDACYTEWSGYTQPGVWASSVRATFVDCEIRGGNGEGDEWSCPTHYPVASPGIDVGAGSDVTLAGTTVVGGVQSSVERSAVWLYDASTVRVRGDSGDLLTATAPAAPIEGSGTATVSGVSLAGAPLPPWVAQPAEAEPFVRLEGSLAGEPPAEVHVHGPAGGAALLAIALEPALLAPPPPLAEPLWFLPTSVIAFVPVTTLGQDVPAVVALPPIPSVPGTTPLVQAWMPSSPTGIAYLTNAAGAVVGG